MNRTYKTLLLAALAAIFLLGVAQAQTFGRVAFTVELPDGTPAAGAVLHITCEEITTFDKTLETNKKGKATLAVVDATKVYTVRVDYEGFPTLEVTVKPDIQSTKKETITLQAVQQAAPAATETPEAMLTPAQEVFNEGVEAYKAEDYETAKVKFLKALEMDPDQPFAHLALGSYYFEIGDYAAALESAARAAELDPQSVRAHRIVYESHTALGNKEEASKAAKVLAEIDKSTDAVAIVFNEGVTAYRVGDKKTAKENFLLALEKDPQLAAALSALAIVYLQEESWVEAAEMTERLLVVEPDNTKALRMRWDAYRAAGNTEKEREAFAALAASDPQVLVTDFYNQGANQFTANDIAGAQVSFEKVLELDPNHARAHYQLGLCLVSQGDSTKAREHLEKFLELAPDDAEAESARQMLSYLD
jgi:tetratricopeptide (TPR) repeat protein